MSKPIGRRKKKTNIELIVDAMFCDFCERIVRWGGRKILDEPVEIMTPRLSVELYESGVDVDKNYVLTFGDYLEMMKSAEVCKLRKGEEPNFYRVSDIAKLIKGMHGQILLDMMKSGEYLDFSEISYRAKKVLDRLEFKYPMIWSEYEAGH